MNPSTCRRRHSFQASHRHRSRLLLERLEDRCVPSAGYGEVNLASDIPGLARAVDPNLAGVWGMASSPTGPFWFADSGSGVSDLLTGSAQTVPIVVSVPSSFGPQGWPAGVVFNPGDGFVVSGHGVSASGQFIFASLDGSLSAWAPSVDYSHAILAAQGPAGAAYTGLAFMNNPTTGPLLYAADFGLGTIDVFNAEFQQVNSAGAFRDPELPANYAPFDVQVVDGALFVTYALQDPDSGYAVPGVGNGLIDVYNGNGQLLRRFATGGALDSPWGLAQAPADFGPFSGALLVGNNGNGQINAFEPASGAWLGTLNGDNGQPIAIPELWSLAFGNNHEGGAPDTLFFTASLDEVHGLFGAIQSPQNRGASTGGAFPFDPNYPGERRDYPLPPPEGPAPGGATQDTPVYTALLPLADSSLALAPTLSSLPPASGRNASSFSTASITALALERPAVTAVLASGTLFVFPTDAASPETAENPQNTASLDRLLDLDPLPELPQTTVAIPKTATSTEIVAERGTPAAPREDLPRTQADKLGDPARDSASVTSALPERTRSEVAALPTPTYAGKAEIASPASASSSDPQLALAASGCCTWTKLCMGLVPVLGIAAGWSFLEKRRRRALARRQVPAALQPTLVP